MLFEEAVDAVRNLSTKPTDMELLTLYGMFKHIKSGDVTGSAPRFVLNPSGYYKWREWAKHSSKPVEDIKLAYVAEVERLVAAYGTVEDQLV